ncbi:tripartite tricarboxylate transporter substrate binding protein [Bordetella sp. N]|uniref:Bug family tripartite tricarboxylate transporter substrate binding protein n=1 Tax=Bordetella sp. N TaxID=1746199 RepID=UPI000710DFD3|nr:tripartite tricarboxylate transporter substrate binding protein [Bordetella sp. N]ALM86081.1 hypothetical protein ASB57_26800 [Bordetella sp. N]
MIKRIAKAAFSMLLLAAASAAHAAYPEKPINLYVPFTPGGTSDIIARMIAEHLGKVWGQTVVVQSKPGAGGTIATTQLMRAEPDGYTLLLTSSGTAVINPHLYRKPPYDSNTDFIHVMLLADLPFVLVVDQKNPISTLAEYLTKAKAKPGTVTLGSAGIGSHQYLAAQQFVAAAHINANLIPYKGTPQQQVDLYGGTLDSMMDNTVTEIPLIKKGTVKPLAITSAKRIPQLPDVPTFGEAGVKGFESTPWYGLAAPKGTPPDVVSKLQAEIAKFLSEPETRKKLEDLGMVLVASTTADARQRIEAENKQFNDIITRLGIELQ